MVAAGAAVIASPRSRRRDHERGTAGLPLISKTETQWSGRATGEGAHEIGLLIFFENFNRADVLTAMTNVPFLIVEKSARNSGIVLHNDLAVREKKVAHVWRNFLRA